MKNHSKIQTLFLCIIDSMVYQIHLRSLKAGDEILDNYGYHYAVMAREERQRKLWNQYYFNCACIPCNNSWATYTSLSQAAVPLPGTQPEQVPVFMGFQNQQIFCLTGKTDYFWAPQGNQTVQESFWPCPVWQIQVVLFFLETHWVNLNPACSVRLFQFFWNISHSWIKTSPGLSENTMTVK